MDLWIGFDEVFKSKVRNIVFSYEIIIIKFNNLVKFEKSFISLSISWNNSYNLPIAESRHDNRLMSNKNDSGENRKTRKGA